MAGFLDPIGHPVQHFRFRRFLKKAAEAEIAADFISDRDGALSFDWSLLEKRMPAYAQQLRNLRQNLQHLSQHGRQLQAELSADEANHLLQGILIKAHRQQSKQAGKPSWLDTLAWRPLLRMATTGLAAAFLIVGFAVTSSHTSDSVDDVQFTAYSYEASSVVSAKYRPVNENRLIGWLKPTRYQVNVPLQTSEQANTIEILTSAEKGMQFLKLMPHSGAILEYDGASITIHVEKGSFYYFGHGGKPVTFREGNLVTRLLGTRVFYQAGDKKNRVARVLVTEGAVILSKSEDVAAAANAGKQVRLVAGEKATVRFTAAAKASVARLSKSVDKTTLKDTEWDGVNELHASAASKVMGKISHQGVPTTAQREGDATAKQQGELASRKPRAEKADAKLKGFQALHLDQVAAKPAPKAKKKSVRRKLAQFWRKYRGRANMPDIRLYMKNGSHFSGKIVSIKNDEVVMLTSFGNYRARVKTVADFKKVRR